MENIPIKPASNTPWWRSVKDILFYTDLRKMPWWQSCLVTCFRILFAVSRDIYEGKITLRATSLVYTTLLSIVPTLAIIFSVLKSFDYASKLKESLLSFLSPMGDKGVEITNQIMQLVERVDPGVLGAVGLAFLVYTIVTMVSKIEASINEIWGLELHRPLVRRFSDYISAVILGPVLIVIVLGIMANFFAGAASESVPGIAQIREFVDLALPNALLILIFLFLYKVLPNDRVSLVSALIGAVSACILWQISGWAFAHFVAGSSRLAELYSVFATVIIFFIWLNFAWLIILIGASITFYHQYPNETISGNYLRTPSVQDLRRISLEIAMLIGHSFKSGQGYWSSEGLAKRLHAPKKLVDHIIASMEKNNLLYAVDSRPPGFVFSRPLEDITVKDIMDAAGTSSLSQMQRDPVLGIDNILDCIDKAEQDAFTSVTIADLLQMVDKDKDIDEN